MSDELDAEKLKARLEQLGQTVDMSGHELAATQRIKTLSSPPRDKRARLHTLPEMRIARGDLGVEAPDLEITKTLGVGGMGVVQLANQVSLDREVAVKTVRDATDESVEEELLEEAYLTGYLEHPNIIPIYTVGRTESGAPLIVMKRVEGVPWAQRLEQNGAPPTDLRREIEILIQVSNAVRFAHSRGIIHRDIKTDNIMIGEFDEVYLLDWGIAVSLDGKKPLLPTLEDDGLTGTPGYMAPEMAREDVEAIDEQTDVYLLGATLHHVLTGTPRHQGDGTLQMLLCAGRSAPYDYGDEVPDELASIANRACHRDKESRFRSAEAFRDTLQDFLRHRESIALSASADEKHAELVDQLTSAQPDKLAIYDAYGECRFGYQQALRMWAGNRSATAGLQGCLEAMAEYHIENQRLDAARACIADLPEPRPELEQRAEELERRLADEQQAVEQLKEMERDLDLSTSSSTRSLLMLIFGLVWTATSLYGALRYGGAEEVTTDAEQMRSHMVSGLRNFAIAATGLFAFRKRIFANAANARMAYMFLVFVAALALLRTGTWVIGESLLMSRMGENALAILLLAAIGLSSDLRICALSLIYVCLGAFTIWMPEYYPYTRPAAIALTFGGFAWLWTPKQMEKKVTL